jgi:hypothetical protein
MDQRESDEMREAERTKTVPASTDREKSHYKATARELASLDAYIAARERQAPRLKLSRRGNPTRFEVDHPHEILGQISLMRAIGTTDSDFQNGLLGQIVNAAKGLSLAEANFMLSVVKGIEPRDQTEAMLAAQMATVHVASMAMARRLACAEDLSQIEGAERAFNKLTRTFAAQVEALKSYRSKGEQRVTVQHVHVSDGGQAIVGNVSASAEGVGAGKKLEDQPHELGDASGAAMPRQIETERAAVSGSGSEGA